MSKLSKLERLYQQVEDLEDEQEAAECGWKLPPRVSEEWFQASVELAGDAFWEKIAERFPEVKHGDFGPGETHAIETAMEEAVAIWLTWNHPHNAALSRLYDEIERLERSAAA